MEKSLTEDELQILYTWVDEIPLSRPKKSINRDFSDGVLFAEVIRHFFPKLIELHNYSPANSISQKLYNWNTLASIDKVLKKLDILLGREDIEAIANCDPGRIEKLLYLVKQKAEQKKVEKILKQQRKLVAVEEKPVGVISPNIRIPERNDSTVPHEKAVPVDTQVQKLLDKKDLTIKELQDHVVNLEARISKYEQLLQIKDIKIGKLTEKLHKAGIPM